MSTLSHLAVTANIYAFLQQDHLTVIDVPGIFRVATPGKLRFIWY